MSAAQAAAVAAERTPRIALLGNPNTGKTTLFNRLCGLRARTSNFPGTTTNARFGSWNLGDERVELVDLPGTYRLQLDFPEAKVCRSVLRGEIVENAPDAVVVVLDATQLSRNLCLAGELLSFGLPMVVALNMVDLAERRGLTLDVDRLAERLGCPVVPLVARRGDGVEALGNALHAVLEAAEPPSVQAPPQDQLEDWADDVLASSVGGPDAVGSATDRLGERLDQAFTHPLIGLLAFVAVMGGLFWTLFKLAELPMDLIDTVFGGLGGWIQANMPEGALRDLLVDGVVGGVAGTVVFLPQICMLFFLISLLEDTGYLARAAFVMDRLLCRFGLPGHAFVPLLSSHACALPGIASTRLIPDRRDRLATILVAPFMSCAARIPVYVVLTGLLFREDSGSAALAFMGCYALGALAALFSAALFRRRLLPGKPRAMVLELPSYKMPSLRTALLTAWHQGRMFLEKAGTVIVAICVVMWWLSAYPAPDDAEKASAVQQMTQQAIDSGLEEIPPPEFLEAKYAQSYSYAGRLGRLAQPIFDPLGYDWQLTVGVLTSFLAREVFVSTMAVLVEGDAEADEQGVIEKVKNATRDDGSPLFTTASAASLLVFFVLAMQCLPTLALTRQEAGGARWALIQLVWMSGLAWIAACITYQALTYLGVG